VTLAMLKEVCAPVFESMDSRQYATEMNLAQLSTSGRRIQLEPIYSFVCCFETKYPDSLQMTFALYKSLLLRLAHYLRLTHLI
jgi:hypothetical protein